MSCSISWPERFGRIYVDRALEGSGRLERALARLGPLAPASASAPTTDAAARGDTPPVRWVEPGQRIPPRDLNHSTLYLRAPRGRPVGRCPGSPGHLCCNYLTADLYEGCPLGCAYCIMRGYLNSAPLVVHLDPEPLIHRVTEIARLNPGRTVRVGTGELGDSLLLDPVFQLSRELIAAFAGLPNLVLELKTKTDAVGHLLDLEPKGNTVIGFSLNPDRLVRRYDGAAAGLDRRLEAARRAARGGYRVSFHFDPIFRVPDWPDRYAEVIQALAGFPASRIAWISLGTFRYTPRLKGMLGERDFLLEEFVRCRDGKYRYVQRTRSRMYRWLLERIRERTPAPVYLCMESPAVWRNVFGRIPPEIPGLSDIFSAIEL
jgi:spore photoproduct lyase